MKTLTAWMNWNEMYKWAQERLLRATRWYIGPQTFRAFWDRLPVNLAQRRAVPFEEWAKSLQGSVDMYRITDVDRFDQELLALDAARRLDPWVDEDADVAP